jgi:thymidylate synthase
MTHVITAKNVNHAFKSAWWWMRVAGLRENSRNGPVLVAPGPVVTEYKRPWERVLWNPKRDANPVFHLMECVWMMAGEDKVDWLSQFNARIETYANDGVVHGAYGHRWRSKWMDQLPEIVNILKKDPYSRQAVLQMWSADSDLLGDWKDRPCNTNAYFDLRGGRLNMTVCCRSNDMLWGAYGANAVHFSFLQEVLAHELRVDLGVYRQMSNNFHVYTDLPMVQDFLENPPQDACDRYQEEAYGMPILQGHETLADLTDDCVHCVGGNRVMITQFMQDVVVRLRDVYLARKNKMPYTEMLKNIPPCDWKLAFVEWDMRRSPV